MRIIGGKYKGRRFNFEIPQIVRPTSDQLRESIFNILENLIDFNEISVVDICAGTGALGFEALSRGAKHCTFIEKSFKVGKIIEYFADLIELNKSKYIIHIGDAVKTLKKIKIGNLSPKFALIFLDPPYKLMLANSIIQALHENEMIQNGGLIVAETSIKERIITPLNFTSVKLKESGETRLEILKFQ